MPIYSFEPIVDEKCTVLILGTMPGVMSLKKQQYYGYDRNAFWHIVYALFDRETEEVYERRKEFLLEHNIALWDVLKACEREGSSDSDIKNPVPNDFRALYRQYPKIRSVCFNGGPARRLYSRFVEKQDLTGAEVDMSLGTLRGAGLENRNDGNPATLRQFYCLPSTSPAYTIPFEQKLEQWKLLLSLLQSG